MLKDAVFTVANLNGTLPSDVEHRIRTALDAAKAAIDAKPQSYECWIEIARCR